MTHLTADVRTFLHIHPTDTVLVALQDLPAGYRIVHGGKVLVLPHPVSAKHKLTTVPLAVGDPVQMYGVRVGRATQPVAPGEPLTTFNLKHEADPYSLSRRQPYHWQPPDVSAFTSLTFDGYHRADGSVGTRNYWLVVPLVFCENRNIRMLQEAFEQELGYGQPQTYRQQVRKRIESYRQTGRHDRETAAPTDQPSKITETETAGRLFPNLDGIRFLTHDMGCGGTNTDADRLCALLAGYLVHPNVAGATVLSLGCQKSQIDTLWHEIRKRQPAFDRPLLYFDQQTYGTEAALLTDAIDQTFAGLIEANQNERRPAPLHKLSVGLKCGGSDGFSGISANPALGHASDLLVQLGATTLLAEFPELCGVEQELIDRCEREDDAARFVELMENYARRAAAVGAHFDMNPSVGNIKDGLITDAIKSAGAARKAGHAPVAGVLDYTEQPTRPGLHLLCTPGNDVLATTGMAASGANLIVFTTGLGTPTGNPVAPTVKVSTNTRLVQRMPDIIDFDAGAVVNGTETIAQNGEQMLRHLIDVASGRVLTKAEQLGQTDFIPWQQDVNL
ncbi:altronate dehydratase [Rudanella paleaurantiibacter]|uniref:Altronate dehydratase n=1 Tax=Rudanella paleaurantiibacter TaxID=2614655 RepID=A0A7J5TTR7_9BACT|nr:altronate dehydratase family protein [Rudanella paleaurantiibacter]KAB7727275.1 altronate dehydratase [Rudanella paleaurantiibacter]